MTLRMTWFALALPFLGSLLACSGDGTGPTTKITVNGKIWDFAGEPIAGAEVLVTGLSPVSSGLDGRFSISGVEAPYDIAFIVRDEPELSWAIVYKGLTRADPTLLFPYLTGAEKSATISGTTPPGTAFGTYTLLAFVSGHVWGGSTADAMTGQYEMTVPWWGSASTLTGQLYLLRLTVDTTGLPLRYDGYSSKSLTVSTGETYAGSDFTAGELTDPLEGTIRGTVAVPAGHGLVGRDLYLSFGGRPLYIVSELDPSTQFAYTVPRISGQSYGVYAGSVGSGSGGGVTASAFFKDGISADAANVSVPLAMPPQPMLPVNRATDVDFAATFSWSQAVSAGVNVFRAEPMSSQHPRFIVYTMGTDAAIPAIPELAARGLDLPSDAEYRWWVDNIFPVTSVDDVASDRFVRLVDLRAGDVGETSSEDFYFTTRPGASAPVPGPPAAGTAAKDLPRRGILRRSRALIP